MLESIHYHIQSISFYYYAVLVCTPKHMTTLKLLHIKKIHVQTLHSLSHSQSQSISKLEDHLENVKVSITVTPFSWLTVNDVGHFLPTRQLSTFMF